MNYDMEMERINKLGNMYCLIKESDPYDFIESLKWSSRSEYQQIFERYDMRWNALIEYDVNAILSGNEQRYFIHEDEWIERYRRRHGVYTDFKPKGMRHISEIADEVQLGFIQKKMEREKWGITLWMEEQGYACHNELAFFYDTEEWKDRAAAARYEWNYICQRCKKKGPGLHVHHHAPIFTAYDFKAYRNFSILRMNLYCQECHEWYHANTIRGCGYYGYQRASQEEIAEEKEYLRKWRHAHDEMKTCKFCYTT
jgi:hypothetical protein